MSKTQRAIAHLKSCEWARDLIRRIELGGGRDEGLLFEARFAFELSSACPGSEIVYEYAAGVGDTTIDFHLIHREHSWLIELVALQESQAVANMSSRSRVSRQGLSCESIHLRDSADNRHETLVAELVHVGEKIEDKVWDKQARRPHKFPEISGNHVHVLFVNLNGFQGTGAPDSADCHELMFGSDAVAPEYRSDPRGAVKGLFDPSNQRPAARAAQARLHAVAFVAERPYVDDDEEIRRTAYFVGNPALDGRTLIQTFPVVAPQERRDPLHRSELSDG